MRFNIVIIILRFRQVTAKFANTAYSYKRLTTKNTNLATSREYHRMTCRLRDIQMETKNRTQIKWFNWEVIAKNVCNVKIAAKSFLGHTWEI